MQALATLQKTSGELSATAAAATAKALIEAKFTIARHPSSQRNSDNARVRILDACKRPAFAKVAKYSKPVGGKKIIGPSIRFAEEAIRAWGNVDVHTNIVWDDEDKIVMHIAVLDLETNTSYGDDVVLSKTVERKFADKDRNIKGERTNSNGEKVFIVVATEDEMSNKINSAKSKVIRNSGLRIIPQDYVDEAMAIVDATLNGQIVDPAAEVKRIVDAFAELRVKPSDIEQYLGHKLDSISPAEINDLRTIYVTIKDGEATWMSYIRLAQAESVPESKPADLASLKSADSKAQTPKDAAIVQLRTEGVGVDHLRDYVSEHKLFTGDLSSCGDFEEFPAKVWVALTANDNKHLKQAIKSYHP